MKSVKLCPKRSPYQQGSPDRCSPRHIGLQDSAVLGCGFGAPRRVQYASPTPLPHLTPVRLDGGRQLILEPIKLCFHSRTAGAGDARSGYARVRPVTGVLHACAPWFRYKQGKDPPLVRHDVFLRTPRVKIQHILGDGHNSTSFCNTSRQPVPLQPASLGGARRKTRHRCQDPSGFGCEWSWVEFTFAVVLLMPNLPLPRTLRQKT